MAVKAFNFTEERFDETKEVYYGILKELGVKNPENFIKEKMAEIPEEKKNGLMFGKMVGDLFKSDDDRREKSVAILERILDDENVSPFVKAYFGEMSGEYIPFDTVLTAAIMVGKGKSLQMGCGEGKTGVLSMAAFAKYLDNKQVFLTSSTPILAKEAMDKLPFYSQMDMAEEVALVSEDAVYYPKLDENGKITYETIIDDYGEEKTVPALDEISLKGKESKEIDLILKQAYSKALVAADNATLMKHAIDGYLPKETRMANRELLADEADFVLLDSYRPIQKTVKGNLKEKREKLVLRDRAYDILQRVMESSGANTFVLDDANQYVDFTKEGREKVVKLIERLYAHSAGNINRNDLFNCVYDALKVETIYKENRDYQVLDNGNEIVSEDRASGVSIDLPQGVKQALEIKLAKEGKYNGKISLEEDVQDTINVQKFFQDYFKRRHFVSGTLGLDSKEIVKELMTYGVDYEAEDVYEIPPKGEGKRIDHGKTMFKNQSEKRKAIVENALENLKSGRPVLIGAVSEEELYEIQNELSKAGHTGKTLIYTAASEKIFERDQELSPEAFKDKYGVEKGTYKNYADLIKFESGKEGVITLGTSIIGRGTTIKTDKAIDKAGGIHVIIDGLHETSSRNQEQFKARTARGTNAGSTIEFFSYEDIPEQYREGIAPEDNADEVYKKVYEKVDARTASVRRNVEYFVEKTTDLIKTITDNPFLTTKQKEQATMLFANRAFSIRNRALGVSDSFKDNFAEYDREMEMHVKMIIASQREKDFDEFRWMQQNGYQDKVSTYLSFSEQDKKKMFNINGIKFQARGSSTNGVKTTAQDIQAAVTERAQVGVRDQAQNNVEEGRE